MQRFLISFIFLYLICPVYAQQFLNLPDSDIKNPDYNVISDYQKEYLNSLYVKKVIITDELINGREYIPYYYKCKMKPLLFDTEKRSGSVLINGREYDSLPLEYDTYLDQLVYSESSKFIEDKVFKISLNKNVVDGFSLYFNDDSLTFRQFTTGSDRKFNLPDGFYEVVYDGKSKYLIKHESVQIEVDGMFEYRYSPVEYVRVGETFSRIRSSASFVRLFGKDSDKVRRYMRTNGVHFKNLHKKDLAGVLRYFDTSVSAK